MSATKITPLRSYSPVTPLRPYSPVGSAGGAGLLMNTRLLEATIGGAAGATDRNHLYERLQRLRRTLPIFAQELASSRRQAAAPPVESRGLVDEVRRLRSERARRPRGAGTRVGAFSGEAGT